MDADSLRRMLGEEYPSAVVKEGTRMVLAQESRFSRVYETTEAERETATHSAWTISRFMDGSASMTGEQLRREWPAWTEWERVDFCQASVWLHKQSDYPEMLRFIMQHGGPDNWYAIALRIAENLPADEALVFLVGALKASEVEKRPNIIQAIAATKHPDADAVLRKHFEAVWEHPDLRVTSDAGNQLASEAKWCIKYLIELGASATDFEDKVRKLSERPQR